jgi:hypothetical protein
MRSKRALPNTGALGSISKVLCIGLTERGVLLEAKHFEFTTIQTKQ